MWRRALRSQRYLLFTHTLRRGYCYYVHVQNRVLYINIVYPPFFVFSNCILLLLGLIPFPLRYIYAIPSCFYKLSFFFTLCFLFWNLQTKGKIWKTLTVQCVHRWNSWTSFLVETSRHKIESSQTRFPFYKMLFMDIRKFFCFADFFADFLKESRMWFSVGVFCFVCTFNLEYMKINLIII
jgi:hypothetical protein